jgi:hypothetical protein
VKEAFASCAKIGRCRWNAGRDQAREEISYESGCYLRMRPVLLSVCFRIEVSTWRGDFLTQRALECPKLAKSRCVASVALSLCSRIRVRVGQPKSHLQQM